MKEYPIYQDHFTKSDCYKSTKVCSKIGIQVHSVGSKGTRKDRWKRSWNAPDRNVCAGYLIDMDGIWEILPEGKRCWLSGSGNNGNANNTHLGFEICEPLTRESTPDVMDDIYGKVLYLCTYLCKKFGISPTNVHDHAELHKMGLASNHADVGHWWGKSPWQDYTMDRLRSNIAKELEGTDWSAPEYMSILQFGSYGEDVKTLQNLLNIWNESLDKHAFVALIVDGKFGQLTKSAVQAFQKSKNLTDDGIVGSETWDALLDEEEQEPKEDLYTVTIKDCTLVRANAIKGVFKNAVIDKQ